MSSALRFDRDSESSVQTCADNMKKQHQPWPYSSILGMSIWIKHHLHISSDARRFPNTGAHAYTHTRTYIYITLHCNITSHHITIHHIPYIYTYTYTYTYTHTYTHTYAHTHIYIYTYSHIHPGGRETARAFWLVASRRVTTTCNLQYKMLFRSVWITEFGFKKSGCKIYWFLTNPGEHHVHQTWMRRFFFTLFVGSAIHQCGSCLRQQVAIMALITPLPATQV